MSIEGIVLENFSAFQKIDIKSTTPSRQRHAVFHSFISDDSKQDAATTNAHSKIFISLLKEKKLMTTSLIKIWESTDGFTEQYRCASALYLMLVKQRL